MATKYVCDACGDEVRARSNLWVAELSSLEKKYRDNMDWALEDRPYIRVELCPKCKRKVHMAMMGEGSR